MLPTDDETLIFIGEQIRYREELKFQIPLNRRRRVDIQMMFTPNRFA